ncbi:MAG: protein kinase [Armatimonadetes bacterium]|nr:protein kinase [Armatimonadota bacterium]
MSQFYKVGESGEKSRITLGARIGEGAEGEIRHVEGHADTLAKLYREIENAPTQKLQAMLRKDSPELEAHTSWPSALVVDESKRIVGFLMPFLHKWIPIFRVYNLRLRRQKLPEADFRFIVEVATNLAAAVEVVHRKEIVIGDLNESNVLVSPLAQVRLIDTDSFQFTDGDVTFQNFLAKTEYLAPELHGRDLHTHARTADHDRFALAILIFQLLMLGRHPFAGRPADDEDISLESAIRKGWYVFGRKNSGELLPPAGLAIESLSPRLCDLFERAFALDRPDGRPTAGEWQSALEEFAQSLIPCPSQAKHVHGGHLESCPWCAFQAQMRVAPFGVGDTSPAAPIPLQREIVPVDPARFQRALVLSSAEVTSALNTTRGETVASVESITAEHRQPRKWHSFPLSIGAVVFITILAGFGILATLAVSSSGLSIASAFPAVIPGLLLFWTIGGMVKLQRLKSLYWWHDDRLLALVTPLQQHPLQQRAHSLGRDIILLERLRQHKLMIEIAALERVMSRAGHESPNAFLRKYLLASAQSESRDQIPFKRLRTKGVNTAEDLSFEKYGELDFISPSVLDGMLTWKLSLLHAFYGEERGMLSEAVRAAISEEVKILDSEISHKIADMGDSLNQFVETFSQEYAMIADDILTVRDSRHAALLAYVEYALSHGAKLSENPNRKETPQTT